MMTIEFAVLDPMTGDHTIVESEDAAAKLFAERAIAMAMVYFNNTPYMKVVKEDGAEKWIKPDGTVQKSPELQIEEAAKHIWMVEDAEIQS